MALTAAVLLVCTDVQAQVLAKPIAPQPGSETPRAEVTRKAPPGTSISRSGPGTQTEDDIYVGHRVKATATPGKPAAKTMAPDVGPATGPRASLLAMPKSPLPKGSAAPAAKPPAGQRTRATGDEDEMDDLDVQRRKAQGLPDNKPTSPKGGVRAGGESPQTERR